MYSDRPSTMDDIVFKNLDYRQKALLKGGKAINVTRKMVRAMAHTFNKFDRFLQEAALEKELENLKEETKRKEAEAKVEAEKKEADEKARLESQEEVVVKPKNVQYSVEKAEARFTPAEELEHLNKYKPRFIAKLKEAEENNDLATVEEFRQKISQIKKRVNVLNHIVMLENEEKEKARIEAEQKEAEEKVRLEAEQKEAEEKARLEAEQKEAEEKARLEAEQKEAEEKARIEAEQKEAEEKARLEAEQKEYEEKETEKKTPQYNEEKASRFFTPLQELQYLKDHKPTFINKLKMAEAVGNAEKVEEYQQKINQIEKRMSILEEIVASKKQPVEEQVAKEGQDLESKQNENMLKAFMAEKEKVLTAKEVVGNNKKLKEINPRFVDWTNEDFDNYLTKIENRINEIQSGTKKSVVAEKEAEERARLEAEQRETEERAKLEAEQREAEEKARLEAEQKEAEEKARLEAEQKEAEEKARLEAEQKEAEEKARLEAEQRETEERAKLEAEQREAEERARLEAEELAKEKEKKEIKLEMMAQKDETLNRLNELAGVDNEETKGLKNYLDYLNQKIAQFEHDNVVELQKPKQEFIKEKTEPEIKVSSQTDESEVGLSEEQIFMTINELEQSIKKAIVVLGVLKKQMEYKKGKSAKF